MIEVYSQSNHHKDSAYIFSLLDTAESMFAKEDYDAAFLYSKNAQQYSDEHNFMKGLAYSLIEQSDIYIDQDSLNKAYSNARQTHKIGIEIKDPLIEAIAIMQMAQSKMYARDYDEAIALFEKCTSTYFNTHASKYAALAYNDMGFTYGQKSEPEKQAACLIHALEIYDKIENPNPNEVAVVLNNLSGLYYSLGQKEKAIEYGERSVNLRKKTASASELSLAYNNLSQIYLGFNDEKAKEYQKLGVKYAEQSGDENRMVEAYIASSLLASHEGDYATSLMYEKKAVALLEKNGRDSVMLSRRYIALGFDYNRVGDSVAAISNYTKALRLSEKLNNYYNLKDVYYYLSQFYKTHNNYTDAYNNYKKYIEYRDSIVNENTRSSIVEIETKYQAAKKDNEIARLNTDQKIKELQIEKQEALIAGNKQEAQRKEKEIELLSQAKELQELKINQQNEQIEKQQLLAKNNAQQLQLAEKEKQLQQRRLKNSVTIRYLLIAGIGLLLLSGYFLFNRYRLKRKIKEQEALLNIRTNIAKELHDEVGSALTSIKILSEVSGKQIAKDQSKASSLIQKITEQSMAAQQGISDIVWAVKPENDKMENMVVRMREYIAHTLESKEIITTIDIDEKVLEQTLEMNQRRDFLMFFKEAVNNIAKHSAAKQVYITIEKQNSDIHMEIKDDGKGFDPEKQTSSSGLKNMKTRAASLSGSVSIASKPGEGTSIDLVIPTT